MNTIKKLTCALLAVISLSAQAYNDHRNARVDSLEAALKSSNPPKGEELLFAYDELMRGYLPYNGEKARHYGCKALALSYQLNELLIRQYTLRNFGLLSYGRQDYDKALDYFNQALAVTDTIMQSRRYTQKDLDDSRSALYGSIANVYNMQGKAHLAISYYQRALPIFERNNWLESQAILYNNIGELYLTMGNEVEAERNYLLAVQKGEASKDSLMVALPRKGLLRIYIDKSDYTKARQTAEQCYGYYHAHRTEETEDYPVVLALLVRLNLMEGHRDMTTAKAYAEEALNLVDSLMFENQSEVYTACCEIAMVERQWQKALGYALHSIHSDSLAMNTDVANYQLLAEIYTELGHKEKAREYIRKMYDVMTRYATDHYQSGLSQMEVLYETEKKEVRIAVLDKERSLYRWLLVAAAIAIVALVAGSFLMMAVHRREKALLAAKVALETETNERRIMARDLHDGLGGMLSLLRLKMEDYKRQMGQQGQQEEVLPLLDNIHTELRRTAHHLMPEELLKNGLLSALRDFAVSVPNARFQTVGNIHLAKETSLVLYRCAYELVNNALKHAEAGLIDIQLIQEPHAATLTVCDNGKGITTAAEGMGLQNIRERIAPYHGKMDIISDANGTEINVTLPL
jgi:signal transduction histidine kinase